jgi:hypothetical protein
VLPPFGAVVGSGPHPAIISAIPATTINATIAFLIALSSQEEICQWRRRTQFDNPAPAISSIRNSLWWEF